MADEQTTLPNFVLDLARQVSEIRDIDEMRKLYVNRDIRIITQQCVDTAFKYSDREPWLGSPAVPYVDGVVPQLDYYTGRIYVRLNRQVRQNELTSDPRSDDRRMTPEEVETLIHSVNYLLYIQDTPEEMVEYFERINRWVQSL